MNKLVLLVLLISFAGYSQIPLHVASGGTVYDSNGIRYSASATRVLMKDNSAALKLYNAGRSKKTIGNLLFYGGIGLAVLNGYQGMYAQKSYIDSNGYPMHEKTKPTLAIIGGAMVLASIPVKIGYPKKIRTAVEEYNNGITPMPEQTVSLTVLGNANGLGLRFQF